MLVASFDPSTGRCLGRIMEALESRAGGIINREDQSRQTPIRRSPLPAVSFFSPPIGRCSPSLRVNSATAHRPTPAPARCAIHGEKRALSLVQSHAHVFNAHQRAFKVAKAFSRSVRTVAWQKYN
jgi:hypothetical protein